MGNIITGASPVVIRTSALRFRAHQENDRPLDELELADPSSFISKIHSSM